MRADIATFFGRMPERSIRATVFEREGKVIAVAGYYILGGTVVVFSDIAEDVPKLRVWRESVKMMQGLDLPAVCIAEEKSGPFLERLGWQFVGPSDDGDVYAWHN